MRAGRSPATLADNAQTQRLMIREKPIELVENQQEHWALINSGSHGTSVGSFRDQNYAHHMVMTHENFAER